MKNNISQKKTMTSLEIAETTGKAHSDVLKAIRKMEVSWIKIGEGNFSLTYYKDIQGRDKPMYELRYDECMYVASKFNDEARAKLVVRWRNLETGKGKPLYEQKQLTPAEMFLQIAQQNLENERELMRIKNEQEQIKQTVKEIELRTNTNINYTAIVGFASRNHIDISRQRASIMGREASKLCKEQGLETGKINDPRFGYVKTYPDSVLKTVFKKYYPQMFN